MQPHQDPTFGHDPWIGPGTPQAPLEAVSHVYTGADTLKDDIGLLPAGLALYASYIDNFGGYTELVAKFGHTTAFLLSITIFGGQARCADVEPGAMIPSALPHWLDHTALKPDGMLPWVYTSAGNWSAVDPQIGDRKVIRFSAHYGFGPHICGPHTCGYRQADWTQWDDKGPGGQNFDRSIGSVIPAAARPHPESSGIAHFAGTYNISKDTWAVHGTPGQDVKLVGDKKTVTGQVSFKVGAGGGDWSIKRQ